MLPRAATEFYGLQQRVNATTANEVGRLWLRMGDDFDASWRRLAPSILDVLMQAQVEVTKAAVDYVPNSLAELNLRDRPSGELVPDSLVGIASDGRPLDSLAYGAVTKSKEVAEGGASTTQALAQGGDWLDLMTKLQVADAARQAVGVMTVSRKNMGGTVRVLNPPSCQRCAILAGRWYRWSTGFDRHPRCDCVNLSVPSESYASAEGFMSDPMQAYRNGEIRDLTEAQKFAINNGADISRVVNATRGMSTTATRRATYRTRGASQAPGPVLAGMPDLLAPLRNLPRASTQGYPTPEGLYQQAAGDRDRAIRLLREWGYID